MNLNQLLSDTGINPFAAKLLAESWDKVKPEVKSVIPTPLIFTIGNCEITLRDSQETKESETHPPTPQGQNAQSSTSPVA